MSLVKELQEAAKGIKVLYAEDEDGVRASMKKILLKFFDGVYDTPNGAEALELYKQHKDEVKFLLTDISMPKMNGLELTENIRKIDPNFLVMIASAHNDNANFLKAVELGVEFFLVKPINNNQLVETLLRICKRIKGIEE